MKWSYATILLLLVSLPVAPGALQGRKALALAWQRAVTEGAQIAASRDARKIALLQKDLQGREVAVMLDGQGVEQWTYYPDEELSVGSVAISPDGNRVFLGFSHFTGPMMPPSEPHPFISGVLALDEHGEVAWRAQRGATGGGCSTTTGAYGRVIQINDDLIACLGPEMEGFKGITMLRADTGQIVWEEPDVSGARAVVAESWDFVVVAGDRTTAYDLERGSLRWQVDTRLFWNTFRACTPDGHFMLADWTRHFSAEDPETGTYVERRGFAIYDVSRLSPVPFAEHAVPGRGYIETPRGPGREMQQVAKWDGEIGGDGSGVTVLILSGPSRTLYRMRPLPSQSVPGAMTTASLPDLSGLASWTTLSPTGRRVAIIDGIGLSRGDHQSPALRVSVLDDRANPLDHATLQLDPSVTRRYTPPFAWSGDGSRLFVFGWGKLAAFDVH